MRTKCGCKWPERCGGTGHLQCEGCGGDLCVCLCGGEMDCVGCDDCDNTDEMIACMDYEGEEETTP